MFELWCVECFVGWQAKDSRHCWMCGKESKCEMNPYRYVHSHIQVQREVPEDAHSAP